MSGCQDKKIYQFDTDTGGWAGGRDRDRDRDKDRDREGGREYTDCLAVYTMWKGLRRHHAVECRVCAGLGLASTIGAAAHPAATLVVKQGGVHENPSVRRGGV